MGVYGAVISEEIVAPDVREQFISGKSYVLVFNKIEKKLVLLRREIYLFAVHSDGSCRYIDFQTAEFKVTLR